MIWFRILKMMSCLKITTTSWTDGRITSISNWMYLVLIVLGRQMCIELSH